MRTARRLFVAPFVLCLLVLVLSLAPVVAQVQVEAQPEEEETPVRLPTAITDDPGPFSKLNWQSLPQIDPGHGDSGYLELSPTILFNPFSGQPIAVWTRGATPESGARDLDGGDVFSSTFTIGGWTGPVLLAEGAADPRLSIDPASGGVHLVYWTPAAGGGVWHRQAPADLSTWSSPVRVSDAREAAARPTVVFHQGRLTIAYESHLSGLGSAARAMVVATRDDQGFSRTVIAHADFAGQNWLRLDSLDAVLGNAPRLLLRWMADAHQAGSALSEQDGVWGPVHLQPLGVEPAPEQKVRGRR